MNVSDLPALNACLNSLSTIMLTAGFIFIKRKNERAHRNCMIAALITSSLFLASYLYYHYHAGRTVFPENWFRPIYLVILLTHTVLAVVIVPLIFAAVIQAIRRKFESHKKITRWAWPMWMYVSVTGVVIYLLLYQIFPPAKL
jgi:putative membrane protein